MFGRMFGKKSPNMDVHGAVGLFRRRLHHGEGSRRNATFSDIFPVSG